MAAVFQLEEGEMLAEPVPARDTRKGCLFYEATEGGAGVLVRLVAEPASLAAVARRALQVMHFDLSDTGPVPTHRDVMQDLPGTACVAACYRCLMSYYNQPDHEKIDRRDVEAIEILLRLASATVAAQRPAAHSVASGASGAPPSDVPPWVEQALLRGIPPFDTEPMMVGGTPIRYVWRKFYVAAIAGDVPDATAGSLVDMGFDVIRGDSGAEALNRLVAAFGETV
jgi:hypothetical protein